MSVPAVAPTEPTTTAVAVSPRHALGLLRPVAPPAEIIAQQNDMRGYIKEVLEEGRDYGVIPGVDKPSLLKPGAERVNAGFGIIPHFTTLETEVDHDRVNEWSKKKKVWKSGQWTGDWSIESGTSVGLYRFVVRCELIHRETGVIVGECLGTCSTMESKYIDRPRDSENTVLKMAQKRAMVGAVLTTYGLSDEFTQDVEDTGVSGGSEVADVPKVSTPMCPKCGAKMRDQRANKKNPKAPDWKCSAKVNGEWCNEVYWPGQWPPADASSGTTASAPTTTEDRQQGNGRSASSSATPTAGASGTSPRKRAEDMTVKGVRLGDMRTSELQEKLPLLKDTNDPQWAPLIAAIEEVLESRHDEEEDGLPF